MDQLLVDQPFQLQRMSGKGGWIYVVIPPVDQNLKRRFGMVKVKGHIDDYVLSCNLMPMGTGELFLPVKAEIRKKIKKKEGDWVRLTLYADASALEMPEELIDCLKDEPKAYENFQKLAEGAQKEFRDWVYSAKKDETKVARIARMIDMLVQGKRLT